MELYEMLIIKSVDIFKHNNLDTYVPCELLRNAFCLIAKWSVWRKVLWWSGEREVVKREN